ncbi:MAG TPA: tetratricopeptide repeat protein, partial [Gemmataceae bacterium]|nr:tetratricopeptide repeat protein [Gemmataceae bacterium]
QLQLAMSFNEMAETRSGGLLGSAPLWKQRAELAAVLGHKEASNRLLEKVKKTPAQSTRDLYLTAHGYAIESNFRAALPLLAKVTRQDPQNYSAWAVLGNCHDAVCQYADALACYSACVALRPDDHHAWHNRGLIYLKQRLFESACADFDEAIRLRPDFADALLDRALALEGLNKYHAAITDLSAALKLGTPRTRVYFMRALAREKLGDTEGAKRDNDEGLRLQPSDDPSWIARGLARQARDPKGALADFDKALALNPRSVDALENKANVLSECLGQRDEAIRVLDRAVALYPDFVPARAGRGVLLARAGKHNLAEADAKEALLRDTRAPNLYQVACIYALNAKQKPENRLQALHLLSQALRHGFGLDVVDQDSDLDPIRNDPEFRRVVKAAWELQKDVTDKGK